MTFEIEGKTYQKIVHEQKKGYSGKNASWLLASMAMMAYTPIYNGSSDYTRKLPNNIDIIEEFKLIQKKQSKLSKWERNEVERIFYNNFKLIEQ